MFSLGIEEKRVLFELVKNQLYIEKEHKLTSRSIFLISIKKKTRIK